MASFSSRLRYAYHVVPLHALKRIWRQGRLSSKAQQGGAGLRRCTTAGVDEALGFRDYVHFYLPKRKAIDFSGLPILRAQLCESDTLAFPHAVLVLDTQALRDEDCTVCNFNIAVSRPSYGEIKGGNHARGTDPRYILAHWRGFRASGPDLDRMRRSHWHDGLEVPVIIGNQIAAHPYAVGTDTKMAELLLRSQVLLQPSYCWYVFSPFDLETLQSLPNRPSISVAEPNPFGWYAERDRVASADRVAIEAYFASKEDDLFPILNFDRVRSKPRET